MSLALMLAGLGTPALPKGYAEEAGRYYPETGKTLAPEFIAYYDSKGGLPIFGYPLTDAEVEGGFKVQYLERARIEYHPENVGTQYDVQLGLLGNILNEGRRFDPAPSAQASNAPGRLYFPQTRHTLSNQFLTYWQGHGGLAQFGYPISQPVEENGVLAQYFERNRFELHPENSGTPFEVLLGLLGRDLLAQRVQVHETTVTLPTYGYEQAFISPAGDEISPYPRLDRSKIGPVAPRDYRLIVMENSYIKLTLLPELGGRLYEVIYKPTGHNELYRNPVIKPSTFGARGWWLAAGGMEWAAPTDEHGLMEYMPWTPAVVRNTDGGATISLSATDKLTGMKVTGSITLNPEDAGYTVGVKMQNGTARTQKAQLWTNAMLAPGGTNHTLPGTRFIVPHQQMVVHSTSDPTLPKEHETIKWPINAGRDLSDTATWKGWLGAFAMPGPQRGQFAAVYNPQADEGIVKTFKNSEMPGLKLFGFGPGFDPHIYTDDDSSYAELWGGATPTFWDYANIAPGASLGWTERWQPVAGLGGVSVASAWGTATVGNGLVLILPTKRLEGATLVARKASGELVRQTFDAYPEQPVQAQVSGSITEIEVLSPEGKSLLKGSVLQPVQPQDR
ncbi:MAG TPA: DUF5107 domain-containing protein [Chloroflexia bacterium]|nr:DUF5107 domain-containing protein [Chloroflexia bacterium]